MVLSAILASRRWAIFVTAAFSVYVGGSVFFAINGYSIWFSRWGAFGTVVGVLYFAKQLNAMNGALLEERLQIIQSDFLDWQKITLYQHLDALNSIQQPSEIDANILRTQERVEHLENTTPEFSQVMSSQFDITQMVSRVEDRSLVRKLVIIVVSTLQWGFGDLPVNRIFNCGEWSCLIAGNCHVDP
jgi:hypothetical protein